MHPDPCPNGEVVQHKQTRVIGRYSSNRIHFLRPHFGQLPDRRRFNRQVDGGARMDTYRCAGNWAERVVEADRVTYLLWTYQPLSIEVTILISPRKGA
jgi:hypothetical protein